jgi:hypoxanthine phosphoribosyltransferase
MIDRIRVHDRTFRPFIKRDEIAEAVTSIARSINSDYAGKELVVIVVLKGALIFAADLLRQLRVPCVVETIRISSYGASMTSSGTLEIEHALPNVTDRHVLIVEDIVDTGLTIEHLVKELGAASPASITVAALLNKPDVHNDRVVIDYVGRSIGPDFVVGYGLDYAGYGRELDAIWIVDEDDQAVSDNIDT